MISNKIHIKRENWRKKCSKASKWKKRLCEKCFEFLVETLTVVVFQFEWIMSNWFVDEFEIFEFENILTIKWTV